MCGCTYIHNSRKVWMLCKNIIEMDVFAFTLLLKKTSVPFMHCCNLQAAAACAAPHHVPKTRWRSKQYRGMISAISSSLCSSILFLSNPCSVSGCTLRLLLAQLSACGSAQVGGTKSSVHMTSRNEGSLVEYHVTAE